WRWRTRTRYGWTSEAWGRFGMGPAGHRGDHFGPDAIAPAPNSTQRARLAGQPAAGRRRGRAGFRKRAPRLGGSYPGAAQAFPGEFFALGQSFSGRKESPARS